uniref:Uncharacterized protein n=1 Tax=Triticum urartu TaxID=4572 RepID=A0A8R7V6G1_TRIUA
QKLQILADLISFSTRPAPHLISYLFPPHHTRSLRRRPLTCRPICSRRRLSHQRWRLPQPPSSMWCSPHVPSRRCLLKIGQEKREADPPRPRAGQAAAMARPDPPAPSSSSTSAPSVGSTSGSIYTTTHWQPLPWKVLYVLASSLPKTLLL